MSAGTSSARGAELRSVEVLVPATSANLGPGFDTLGLALSIYDEMVVTAFDDELLEIEVTGTGADLIARDESNLVYRALVHTYEDVGHPVPGLRMVAHNQVPHGRGMGSSGAAVVSGILAAVGLLEGEVDFTDTHLLRLATELEGHPDNVAPALFGGLTIAWMGESGPQHHQLLVHRGVAPLLLVPEHSVSTKVARSLQPMQVPREDAVFNVSRSALLIAALTQSPELLMDATADRLHQDYRAQAMPETQRMVRELRAAGFAAVVSGAGPSVLVLADGPGQRLEAAALAATVGDTPWEQLMLAVDVRGGRVRVRAEGTTSHS